MKTKIISLILSLALILGLAAVSSAQEWAEIIYGGYVTVTTTTPAGIMVLADTGIWVFNPNTFPIMCNISHLIDKYGNITLGNAPLLDGGQPISSIPRGGNGWITLGQLLAWIPAPGPELGTNKYTFRIACTGNTARVPVVQVKEVIYYTEQEILHEVGVIPNPILDPTKIRTWAETSLGGPTGTGKYKP
jgi:hypothetical protein